MLWWAGARNGGTAVWRGNGAGIVIITKIPALGSQADQPLHASSPSVSVWPQVAAVAHDGDGHCVWHSYLPAAGGASLDEGRRRNARIRADSAGNLSRGRLRAAVVTTPCHCKVSAFCQGLQTASLQPEKLMQLAFRSATLNRLLVIVPSVRYRIVLRGERIVPPLSPPLSLPCRRP